MASESLGKGSRTFAGSAAYELTGKPVSATTGLYYEYQRWYDPSMGRFISVDPLPGRLSDPQTSNRYVYASNSPTVLTDPAGLSALYVNARDLCWDWGAWKYASCSSSTTGGSTGGVTGAWDVGGPSTGITSAADPGALLLIPASIIAGAALWGLHSLVEYLRTPPVKLPDPTAGGSDWPSPKLPTPPDPGLEFRVGTAPTLGLGSAVDQLFDLGRRGAGGKLPTGPDYVFANSLRSWVRRAYLNPTVHKICAGSALTIGVGLYLYEDLESAKQGLQDRPDIEGIVKGVAALCYAGAGFLLSVPH